MYIIIWSKQQKTDFSSRLEKPNAKYRPCCVKCLGAASLWHGNYCRVETGYDFLLFLDTTPLITVEFSSAPFTLIARSNQFAQFTPRQMELGSPANVRNERFVSYSFQTLFLHTVHLKLYLWGWFWVRFVMKNIEGCIEILPKFSIYLIHIIYYLYTTLSLH